jgi:hypothetical protein
MGTGDERACPMCGGPIEFTSLTCRFCGEDIYGTGALADPTRIEEAARRLKREKYDKTTALEIFITGFLCCFSPIIVIYATVFLLLRPYEFPRKGLAIAGTVLHWLWTVVLVALIFMGAFSPG